MTTEQRLRGLMLATLITLVTLSSVTHATTYSNDRLQGRIETALLLSEALLDFPIAVKVTDTSITLSGNVASSALVDLAAQVAHGMADTRTVDSELMISPARPIPDAAWRAEQQQRQAWLQAQMIAELRLAIQQSPALEGAGIEIEIDGETAILRGTVSTETSRMVASQLAQNLSGIAVVNNRLEVGN